MLAIAATAKQFGIRPSSLLAIQDSTLCLAFDLAAAVRMQRELAALRDEGVERTVF